jgi:hypothetical protein
LENENIFHRIVTSQETPCWCYSYPFTSFFNSVVGWTALCFAARRVRMGLLPRIFMRWRSNAPPSLRLVPEV